MAWIEATGKRTLTSKTWRDSLNPARHVCHHVLGTILHYPTVLDSDILDGEVDFTPQRVTAGGRDLYRVTVAGWHYALGKDVEGIFANVDGVVGFGGRQGQHWLKFRLQRVGYLHWPTRAWDDIGGAPDYVRARLSQATDTLIVGPEGAQATLNIANAVTWERIWSTPAGGQLDIAWRVEGRHLKEEITVNQAAREWIAANRPPATPPTETWFGFVFKLDVSDIPRWVKAGILQDINGDFDDDDGDIQIRDALDRLLGFMPVSCAYSELDENGKRDIVRLRKRIWRGLDGNHYLLIGARVDQLNAMDEGAIVFDPTFETQPAAAAGQDTELESTNPDACWGSGVALYLHNTIHILIEFDISDIPEAATCDSATMSLWTITSATDPGDVPIYELLAANADWEDGTTEHPAASGQATWDHRKDYNNGDVNWAGSAGCSTPGTDYDATKIGDIPWIANTANAECQETLTAAAVQDWFGESNENYGMVLPGISTIWTQKWHTSDGATAGYRPKLVIEYTTVTRRVFITHT